MGFLSFIVLLGIAYLVWRVTDQLPDLIFRISEIQRDIAEIRRRTAEEESSEPVMPPAAARPPPPATPPPARPAAPSTPPPAAPPTSTDTR